MNQGIKSLFLFLLSLFLGFLLFLWIGKIVGWKAIGKSFLVFTGWQGLVIFSFTFLRALVGNWRWKVILEGEEVKSSFFELLPIYLSVFAIILLAPALLFLGEISQAWALRRKKKISFQRALSSVIIARILEWTANLTIVIIALFVFFYLLGGAVERIVLPVLFFLIFPLFFFLLFFYLKATKGESFVKFFLKFFRHNLNKEPLETEKEIFRFFSSKERAKWILGIFLSFLRTFLMYCRDWFLILFLGGTTSFLKVIPVLGFSYLAAIFPIPTALGVHEALQTFAFGSLNLGVVRATAFTTIIRASELLLALFGLFFIIKSGFSSLGKIFSGEKNYYG